MDVCCKRIPGYNEHTLKQHMKFWKFGLGILDQVQKQLQLYPISIDQISSLLQAQLAYFIVSSFISNNYIEPL